MGREGNAQKMGHGLLQRDNAGRGPRRHLYPSQEKTGEEEDTYYRVTSDQGRLLTRDVGNFCNLLMICSPFLSSLIPQHTYIH